MNTEICINRGDRQQIFRVGKKAGHASPPPAYLKRNVIYSACYQLKQTPAYAKEWGLFGGGVDKPSLTGFLRAVDEV